MQLSLVTPTGGGHVRGPPRTGLTGLSSRESPPGPLSPPEAFPASVPLTLRPGAFQGAVSRAFAVSGWEG